VSENVADAIRAARAARAEGHIWESLPILSTFELDELILAVDHRRRALEGIRRGVRLADTRSQLTARLVQLGGLRHRLSEIDRKVHP